MISTRPAWSTDFPAIRWRTLACGNEGVNNPLVSCHQDAVSRHLLAIPPFTRHLLAAAEETLAGIHEGNFARYRVRSSEYEAWKASWTETGSAYP